MLTWFTDGDVSWGLEGCISNDRCKMGWVMFAAGEFLCFVICCRFDL